jgi:hypothetical protein
MHSLYDHSTISSASKIVATEINVDLHPDDQRAGPSQFDHQSRKPCRRNRDREMRPSVPRPAALHVKRRGRLAGCSRRRSLLSKGQPKRRRLTNVLICQQKWDNMSMFPWSTVRSAFTAAMCMVAPTSIAAAFGWTADIVRRSLFFDSFRPIANPPTGAEGWAALMINNHVFLRGNLPPKSCRPLPSIKRIDLNPFLRPQADAVRDGFFKILDGSLGLRMMAGSG